MIGGIRPTSVVVVLAREPEAVARERLTRGIRGRSFDVLLACFASSVGADAAILLGAPDAAGPRAIASWGLGDGAPSVAGIAAGLLERAGETEGAAIEADGDGVRAAAAVVRAHDAPTGVLYVGFDPPSALPREELAWAVESYARLAALCMHEDVTVAAALGSGAFDSLTGCLSYGGAIETLHAEMRRSARRGHNVALCAFDVDGFKQLNAARGHVVGNRVLSAVGAALRFGARRYDAVGRVGADEFVVILPETDADNARLVAERLQATVRSALAEATAVPLDASCGVVVWDGEMAPAELLDGVTALVHRAKSRGGGRVEVES